MSIDTVKISVSKLGTQNNETLLFPEEFTVEFNVIQKIWEAKMNYKNMLQAYFDGVFKGISTSITSGTISAFERKRLELTYRKYESLREQYFKILNNFSIESIEQISYLGNVYSLNESIRRFTMIHIEELSEVDQVKSASVVNAKKEYEAQIAEFLQIVRFSPFNC